MGPRTFGTRTDENCMMRIKISVKRNNTDCDRRGERDQREANCNGEIYTACICGKVFGVVTRFEHREDELGKGRGIARDRRESA